MELSNADGTRTEAATRLVDAARLALPAAGAREAEARVWYLFADGLQHVESNAPEARRLFAAAAAQADTMPGRFDQHVRFVLRQREALMSLRLGGWPRAGEEFGALLTRTVASEGARSADALQVELNQAQLALMSGATPTAVSILDRIYPDFLSVYGPGHRLTEILLAARAQSLAMVGRYDDSIRDDLTIRDRVIAQQGPSSFYALALGNDIAESQCRAGKLDEGLATARRAYADTTASFGKTAALADISATTLAFCLILSGRPADAEPLLASVDARKAGVLAADPDYDAQLDIMRAAVDLSSGDVADADALMRSPRRVYERPGADPYLRSWTGRLSARIEAAAIPATTPVLRTP